MSEDKESITQNVTHNTVGRDLTVVGSVHISAPQPAVSIEKIEDNKPTANGYAEHDHERVAEQAGVVATVEAELHLVNVGGQVLDRDLVIPADDGALEQLRTPSTERASRG